MIKEVLLIWNWWNVQYQRRADRPPPDTVNWYQLMSSPLSNCHSDCSFIYNLTNLDSCLKKIDVITKIWTVFWQQQKKRKFHKIQKFAQGNLVKYSRKFWYLFHRWLKWEKEDKNKKKKTNNTTRISENSEVGSVSLSIGLRWVICVIGFWWHELGLVEFQNCWKLKLVTFFPM